MSRRANDEPIEDYLDELLSCLRLPPRQTRRLLSETEDHLRQTADAREQRGVPRVQAEREAISDFGSASRIASEAGASRRADPATVLRLSLWTLVTLAGTALAAIGLSGAVAAAFLAIAGPHFVGALPQTYPAGLCRYFLTVHPRAVSCGAAATLENSRDAVGLRLLAGAFGGILLSAAAYSRRYVRADVSVRRMWNAASAVIATFAFAAAASWLLGSSVDIAVQHGSGGVGWYLSGAIVSLLGAGAAAVIAWRNLRLLRPWAHVIAAG